MKAYERNSGGFSLVEVVTALGIVAICVLTLMGLLAVGVNSGKTTVDQSIAVNIAGAVAADLRATPVITQSYSSTGTLVTPRFGFHVPAPASGLQCVFVNDEGTPLTTMNANLSTGASASNGPAAYRVTVQGSLSPTVFNSTKQRSASPVYILVTWPGGADPIAGSLPNAYAGSYQVVTYIDQN